MEIKEMKEIKKGANFISVAHAKSRKGFKKSIKIIDCKGNDFIDYREYYNTAGSCKVLLWAQGSAPFATSGKDYNGYASNALSEALQKAGIKVSTPIDGDEAIKEVLLLLARKQVKNKKLITVISHA